MQLSPTSSSKSAGSRVILTSTTELADLKRVLSFPPYPGDYLHPVVYACTAVMLLCLLVSIMTYIVHHSVIRISRNGWHTLLNFLFHTGLTFGVFAGGINQINLPFVCQIVGIVLHYASLSTMLWLTFTARNICKDVSKDPLRAHKRTRSAQTRTKPTILRFYLVSDGIPLIIVGVTAAFGMDNYGSRDDALYCWMAWEPSLGGFYAPVSFLVLVVCVYLLCSYIQLKRHPEKKYELRLLSEEQQQLSSSESNHHCHTDTGGVSAGDCPPFATGVSVLANEHSFKSQLRATAFTLFLFLSTWALGALAVSLGHFLDMIFSCLYGAFCVTLGLFLLIQHCAKRDDVWHRWWACCPSKSEDRNGDIQNQRQELHQPHCHLSSPCSGKQPLLSPYIVPSSYHTPPSHSPPTNHTGPCCVAVMSPVTAPLSPLPEQLPSPHPQTLSGELPRPTLPLQSCLNDRTKSRSFNRPRLCLQDYRSHLTSTSMDGSVHSPHLDSPHAPHHLAGSPLICQSPHPDLQLPCPSPLLDKQLASCQSLLRQNSCHSVQDSIASCHSHAHNMHDSITSCHSLLMPSHGVHTCQWHMYSSADHSSTTSCCEKPDPFTLQYQQDPDTYSSVSKTRDKEKDNLCVEEQGFPRNTLPRQGTMGRRGTIGRNRSLQEEGLFGSDGTGTIRTGPWKNETTV
ncbi:LOW QUALITY PROTEIN: adhesion G protein-coupled receptor A1-like [Gymnodraco acuticeps]|uniref:LOW QUALITY PROTEIN: adhesion G protein-coupled receptor A1-like n=1 Tax=Gymnodraco acuticeps TaxID=8218 RepID=A0A6P8U257_GYMAC|nr:LOW QUALITY PROTEIN: adhesion G protein-coupled receptor A1-like [Gymnodraco acuticeps]